MTTIFTDPFTRADSPNLGANYGFQTQAFAIAGNQASNPATFSMSYYSAVALPNDQWCQATLTNLTSANGAAVTVRQAVGANTHYAGGFNSLDFANSNRRIWKNVAGTRTSLATEAIDIVAGDVLLLWVQGTTITLFVNGVQRLSVVDAAIASGSPGLFGRTAAANTPVFDDLSVGDFLGGYTQIERGLRGIARGLAAGSYR